MKRVNVFDGNNYLHKVFFSIYKLKFNPFVLNAPFLCTLKTSENRKVFWCFQAAEKGCIGNKWVNLWKNMSRSG